MKTPSNLRASPTFCIAAYQGLYIDMTNYISPCCVYKPDWQKLDLYDSSKSIIENYNQPAILSLRKNLDQGIKDPRCNHCWNYEKTGHQSLRQTLNNLLSTDTAIDDDYRLQNTKFKYLDIRFNNKCNLKCRSCSVRFSNSWYVDQKKLTPSVALDKNIASDITVEQLKPIMQDVEHIYFAGGEPLITDEHYELLDHMITNKYTNVYISYNTNFSKLTYKKYHALEYWKHFRKVSVNASLDGSYARGEYIRKNLNWQEVLDNVQLIKSSDVPIEFKISPTVSIMNAYNVIELHREWVEKEYIGVSDININPLFGPSYLCIKNLPSNHKTALEKLYVEHVSWMVKNKASAAAVTGFRSLINLLRQPADPDWKQQWQFNINAVDSIRNENFYSIFTEYQDLL